MQKHLRNALEIGDLSGVTTYQAGVIQAAAHRSLQRRSDEILAPYGLTKMQWLVIGLVLEAGPEGMRNTDIARQLGTTLAYVTNAVNLLVSRRILKRRVNNRDSRSKLISIHPDFESDCEEIERTLRTGLRKAVYEQVSPIEFRVYLKVLYQLSKIR